MTPPKTPAEQVETYYNTVLSVAAAMQNRFKALGHDGSDLAQMGFEFLLRKRLPDSIYELSDAERNRYAGRAIMHSIARAARGKQEAVTEPLVDRIDDRGHHEAAVDIQDILESCPDADARQWLEARCTLSMTWDQAGKYLGWTNVRISTARMFAATWLLHLFEGSNARTSSD